MHGNIYNIIFRLKSQFGLKILAPDEVEFLSILTRYFLHFFKFLKLKSEIKYVFKFEFDRVTRNF